MIYLIGSLRNKNLPVIAETLRSRGYEVFDDWHGAGPKADDHWRDYERFRERSYRDALRGAAAKNVFQFDKRNIDSSSAVVLVMPAGKSGHLEFGYAIGSGKKGYVLFEQEPERWDVMYNFATDVAFGVGELIERMK